MNWIFYFKLESYRLQQVKNLVKLDIKELLHKEKTGFKELFTDYQPFYAINILLNKELWSSRKCQNLSLVYTRL